MSSDELTGAQALERKHPGLPMGPGQAERIEFEYIRHGTRSFILSRDVATGEVVVPYAGPTRTEADFLAHVQRFYASFSSPMRLGEEISYCTQWREVGDEVRAIRFVAQASGLRPQRLALCFWFCALASWR